jgi:hypothetical protein
MKLSISQLSELIGEDRRTFTAKIKALPHEDGAKGAMLYYSAGIGDPIALRTREFSHLCVTKERNKLDAAALGRHLVIECRKLCGVFGR